MRIAVVLVRPRPRERARRDHHELDERDREDRRRDPPAARAHALDSIRRGDRDERHERLVVTRAAERAFAEPRALQEEVDAEREDPARAPRAPHAREEEQRDDPSEDEERLLEREPRRPSLEGLALHVRVAIELAQEPEPLTVAELVREEPRADRDHGRRVDARGESKRRAARQTARDDERDSAPRFVAHERRDREEPTRDPKSPRVDRVDRAEHEEHEERLLLRGRTQQVHEGRHRAEERRHERDGSRRARAPRVPKHRERNGRREHAIDHADRVARKSDRLERRQHEMIRGQVHPVDRHVERVREERASDPEVPLRVRVRIRIMPDDPEPPRDGRNDEHHERNTRRFDPFHSHLCVSYHARGHFRESA